MLCPISWGNLNYCVGLHNLFIENDSLKEFINNNPKSYISLLLLENFINSQTIAIDEIQKSYDKLDKSLLANKHALNIKKAIDAANAITIRKPAPDFSAPSPESTTI